MAIFRNPENSRLRAKGVVIISTGHHLTSQIIQGLFLSHNFQNICQREFVLNFVSVSGILQLRTGVRILQPYLLNVAMNVNTLDDKYHCSTAKTS